MGSNPFAAMAALVGDSLANLVSGMGSGGDKSRATRFVLHHMDPQEAHDAYRGDWLSRRIVDTPANDATREWRAWQADKAQIEKLEAEEKRLNVIGTVNQAIKMARVYGGAGIIIGVKDETDPSRPLDPETIRAGGIAYLLALPRHKLTAGDIDWTPGPTYGVPRSFSMPDGAGGMVEIHHSRVARFIGAEVFSVEASDLMGWGDPVLGPIRDAVVAAGSTIQEIATLVHEAKIDILGIPRLSEKVGNKKDRDDLLSRTALAQISKSNHGVFIKDAAEEWEQKQISFANMPELIQTYLQIASGAADIPATRLLGQSPAGMNSTGESDLINYYDRVGADQRNNYQPRLEALDDCLIRSALGSRPDKVHYSWRPLWQMSEKDKAEVSSKKAATTKVYKDAGLLPESALAEVVENQLIEDGVYPGIEEAMETARAANELAPYEEPDPLPGMDPATGQPLPAPANQNRRVPTRSPRQAIPQQRAANDARPRPLYVSRPVINADELIQWAREQGFKTTLPADQLHVTQAYSKRPLDWAALAPRTDFLVCKADDAGSWFRWVAKLGDDGAVVLMFQSQVLQDRWQAFIDAGASWDYDSFMPHVTISYDAAGYLDPMNVTAFLGPLELGPERYDAISDDPEVSRPREVSTEGGTN